MPVTKRIEFCYGHRLLDYDGMCAHPHGHNAVAELEIQATALDRRNMVMDFGDIKRAIKTWVDRELDAQDDPARRRSADADPRRAWRAGLQTR